MKAKEGGDKKAAKTGAAAAPKKDKSPTGKKSPSKAKKAAGPLPEIEKQSQLKKKEDIEDEERFIGILNFYVSKIWLYLNVLM